MASNAPPSDVEAEKACIGASLLSVTAADHLLDLGLRQHHFFRPFHGEVWAAIQALREVDTVPDVLTVLSSYERINSRGDEHARHELRLRIDDLSSAVPEAGNALIYGERVMEFAEWRDRLRAAQAMVAAADTLDAGAFSRAVNDLEHAGNERRMETLAPAEWAMVISDYLSAKPEEGFIPLPFQKITDGMGGGLLPGEILLLAGWTWSGKSILADQILDKAASKGKRCHLYMTEMTAAQRGLRYLSRGTGIPFSKLRSRRLKEHDWKKVLDELERVPYGVTVAAGWDMEDVVRDALRARWDLVVIDLIHGFHYQDERDLDRMSKAAMRLARVSTTRAGYGGTAVILIAHLSGGQLRDQKTGARPRPAMHSIKGAQSLSQDPDYVMFVWQEEDKSGMPTGEGAVWIPKARGGGAVEVAVHLNTARFRFDPVEPDHTMLGVPIHP